VRLPEQQQRRNKTASSAVRHYAAAVRSLAQAGLLPISLDDRRFGLREPGRPARAVGPAKLAVVCNVGPLVGTSRAASISARTVSNLFSHSDQVWWHTAASRPSQTGWAGRTADHTWANEAPRFP
jgi:hypothetical protein